jgi:hypothetical protein
MSNFLRYFSTKTEPSVANAIRPTEQQQFQQEQKQRKKLTHQLLNQYRIVSGEPKQYQQPIQKEELLYELPSGRWKILFNTIFTLAAFPVHAWGFFVVPDKYLLLFPLSFTILWLFYSIQRAHMTIHRICLLSGREPRSVEIATYTMWGGSRTRVVSRTMINPILDDDVKRRQQFIDIYQPLAFQTPQSPSKQTPTVETAPASASRWRVKRYIVDLKRGKICSNTFFRIIPCVPPQK